MGQVSTDFVARLCCVVREPALLDHLLNVRAVFLLLGMLAGGMLAGLGWGAVMRRHQREHEELLRRGKEREGVLRERYRELLDNSSDVVYSHALEGRFTTLNKAGEQATGYTAEEIVQKSITDLSIRLCGMRLIGGWRASPPAKGDPRTLWRSVPRTASGFGWRPARDSSCSTETPSEYWGSPATLPDASSPRTRSE